MPYTQRLCACHSRPMYYSPANGHRCDVKRKAKLARYRASENGQRVNARLNALRFFFSGYRFMAKSVEHRRACYAHCAALRDAFLEKQAAEREVWHEQEKQQLSDMSPLPPAAVLAKPFASFELMAAATLVQHALPAQEDRQ